VSKGQESIKYFEKLNISVCTISKIKDLIKTNIMNTLKCWDDDININKQTFHIVGPAGVGKSQICEQLVAELSEATGKEFKEIMIKCPVLSRDDFLVPFPVKNEEGDPKLAMLYTDFVPVDQDTFGVLIIDEFSRGDHSLQQLMWQIQNDYKIHLKELPKGWFVIAVDNPDDQEYNMNVLEDAAGLRRMLHIYVDVSPDDFLSYAIEKKFHPLIIEFIQSHPEFIYDFEAQKIGGVYANPGSYEKVSDILIGYENAGGIEKNLSDIEPLISGLLNVSKTRMFVEFVKDQQVIKPKDIFNKYDKVKGKINQLVKLNNNAKLAELVVAFTTYLTSSKPEYKEKQLKNVAAFLTAIPLDTAAIFVSQVDNFSKTSDEFKYVGTMHAKLMKSSEDYKRIFYENLIKCAEAKK